MKKTSPSDLPADPLICGAKTHFEAAGAALRTGCAEALITGLHLLALHARSSVGQGGDRRSLGAQVGGFESACHEIGIPKRTAYRWINACTNALFRATLIMDAEDLLENLPEVGSAKWAAWQRDLRTVADGMSLSRLLLGTSRASTEEHRYDELISADEEGREVARELLEAVAAGKYSLIQAVKALGSREAYDRLRAEGREKLRKDPVYLDYDPVEKRPVGLLPKAFVTLHNGFQRWETYDVDARDGMRRLWLEVVKSTPRELAELLKK